MNKTTLIHASTIITEDTCLHDAWLICENGLITAISDSLTPPPTDVTIEAQGLTLTSGFIDVHIHGVLDADTMDATPSALATMARHLVSRGVTAFLPTTLTASREETLNALNAIQQAMTHPEPNTAHVLGAHLEGPYLNPAKCGAQNLGYIRRVDPEEATDFLDTNVIRLVSLAPEYPESTWLIAECQRRNITTSIAHTNATYQQTHQAIEHGITHSTHTYNAMTGLHHREPGALGAVMSHSQVSCELICDNIHVHPAAQKVLWQAKGHDNLILITDAMRATAMPEGSYKLGEYDVTVKDHIATLPDGTLAGSILNYDEGVRNFAHNIGLPFTEIWRTTSLNPARAAHIDQRKGSIAIGKDADLVLLDANLNVYTTLIMGQIAYTTSQDKSS